MAKRTFKQPNNTKNNTNAACKVTKHAKLALFAQYCYIGGGRNGSDHPDIETLIHSSSSQQAGEKRLNQVFSGVRGQIRSLAGATLIGSSMMLGGVVANADDNPALSNQVTATPVAMSTTAPTKIRTMSLQEIVKDHTLNRDRVILHYGEGIVDADLAAAALDSLGTPTIAIAGGPNNGVQLILSGFPIRQKIFTQSDLNRGEVTGPAPALLKRVQEKQAAVRKTAQHASLIVDR